MVYVDAVRGGGGQHVGELQHGAHVGVVRVGGLDARPLPSVAPGYGVVELRGGGSGGRVRIGLERERVKVLGVAGAGDEHLEEAPELDVRVGRGGDEVGALVRVEARQNGDLEDLAAPEAGDGHVWDGDAVDGGLERPAHAPRVLYPDVEGC